MAQYMPYPPQPPSPQGAGGYPPPQAYGGYPPPQAYGGYPAPPQGSGGYPVPPQAYGGYPPPQAPRSYPSPQMPGAYPSPQLPSEIQQQAAAYQLGALVQVYKRNSFRVFVAPIFGLGIAVLYPLNTLTSNAGAGTIVVSLIISIVLIIVAVRSLLNYSLSVYVFTEGAVRAKGSTVDVLRWDQIEAVWIKIIRHRYRGVMTLYTSYTYTVRRGDGAEFKFTSALQGVSMLGDAIEKEVTRRHMPRAIAAYNSGGPVYFGPLMVSMQGISNGVRLLPWHEVGQVSLMNGSVIVPKVTNILGGFSVRVRKVPNVQVFLQLVGYACGRANGR